jgi:folate-binding protein YgfZ
MTRLSTDIMNDTWPAILARHGAKLDAVGRPYFERPAQPSAASLIPLLAEASLLVRGADAADFLQGQLTSDLDQVTNSRGQPAAYCTAKGRVLATFVVWPHDEGYVLRLPAELAQPIRQRLQKYILRARVAIEDISNHVALLGVVGAGSVPRLRKEIGVAPQSPYDIARVDGVTAMALPGDRVELSVPAPEAARWFERLTAAECTPGAQQEWDLTSIAQGIPTVGAATSEAFVPQMLNLELIGAVAFSKGCYPGQEIVARSQYRGQVKRRLYRFSSEQPTAPGAPVLARDGSAAGSVVNAAAALHGHHELLAVVATELADASLSIAPAGPLLLRKPLPYAVPQPIVSETDSDGI